MKILKLKNKVVIQYKCVLFVILIANIIPALAQTPIEKRAAYIVTDSITGQVLDAVSKKALAGVKIQSINQQFSAMSDENGMFSIKPSSYIHTLIVSAPGYDKKEIPIYRNSNYLEIEIIPSAFKNYYTDVNTPFGIKRKSTVTTAIGSFEMGNSSSISADEELQKELMGDIFSNTHSGVPAGGAFMSIRGINSLNSNTMPLIVVDGIILDNLSNKESINLGNIFNPISGIDVNDIRRVSVLKDGTSLYGSKGGNGVILINTKRGESMVTKIAVSGMVGYNQKPRAIPMMNADEYRIYLSDLLVNETAQNSLSDQYFLNSNPDFVYYNKYHNNTNWADGVYRSSTTQSYNVTVNGGDEIALYNLSIGLTNALSTLEKNDFNRVNARFNSDINLSEKLNTIFDISYSNVSRELRNDGIAESKEGQINSPGYLSLIKSPFLSPYQYDNGGTLTTKLENYDFLKIANPYAVLEYGTGHLQQTNFNIALKPTYQINKSLNISSHFSYSLTNISENMYSPMYGVAPYIDYDNDVISNNYVKTQFAHQTSLYNDTKINWKKKRNEHHYELNAGMQFIYDSYKSEFGMGHNTGSDQAREMSSNLQYKVADGIDGQNKLLSYYGVFDYAFRERYFAETAFTFETNSRFGSKTKSGVNMLGVSWALFPSLNVAWLISSENFMKNLNFINQLKLRAGIGTSGNDGIEDTAARSYFASVKYANNATGIEIHNIANPAIQWETVVKRNVGLDASVANDRISISFDLYSNTTNNLLSLKSTESIGGISTYWTNGGKLRNNGFELGLNANFVRSKDFNFNLGAKIAHYSNKILALPDGDYLTTIYGAEILTAVNQPIGQLVGYKTDGVFATGEEAALAGLTMQGNTGKMIPFEAGDVKFVNTDNSDNIINDQDKVVIGNTNPDFFGEINAMLKYKKVGMNLLFNYSYGNDVYNYLRSQLESGSSFYNQSTALNNRWIGDGQKTAIPKSVYGDPKQNGRFSDRWVEDGSYIRLKILEITYDLPVGKIGFLQGATLWASVNNLFTLTNYLGADPEFSAGNSIFYQGVDIGLLPQSRSFNIGFKVYL